MDLTQFNGYTPGPWRVDKGSLKKETSFRGISEPLQSTPYGAKSFVLSSGWKGEIEDVWMQASPENLKLISSAPALLDYARSLEATVKSLKERLEYVAKEADEDESKLEQANRELKSELDKERARANQFFDGMTKAEAELDEQRKYISCLEGNIDDTKALEAQIASLKAHADRLAGTLEDIKPYIQDQYCRGKIQEAQQLYRKEMGE